MQLLGLPDPGLADVQAGALAVLPDRQCSGTRTETKVPPFVPSPVTVLMRISGV
jgi:hypothetical protein